MAARAVCQAKRRDLEVKLFLLLPYHPAARDVAVAKEFDGTIYPALLENVPRRFAIPKANQYMVSHVTHIIAYVWHSMGGSGKTLEYAKRKKQLTITNLAEIRPLEK